MTGVQTCALPIWPAAGGGGARQADPRRGAATRLAAQPARRDQRIRAARSAAVNGGKAVVACATGVRTRGGGGGGSLRSNPLTPPPNPRAHLEGRGVEGRASGRGDRTTRRGTDARRGRRRGEGRGRASRRGRTRLFPPDPHTLPRRPPNLSRARLLAPQRHRGAAAPPDAFVLLPLSPAPFPSRAAHGWRRGSRAGRGGARPPRAALGTDRVNDPSAGSPTETLLRLLLPLDSQVRPSSQRSARAVGRPRRGRSEGLTKPSNR